MVADVERVRMQWPSCLLLCSAILQVGHGLNRDQLSHQALLQQCSRSTKVKEKRTRAESNTIRYHLCHLVQPKLKTAQLIDKTKSLPAANTKTKHYQIPTY